MSARLRALNLPWADAVLVIGLLIAIVVMSNLSPNFLTISNLLEVTRFSSEIGLIALGMTLVIITGGIDLSVGAMLGLNSMAFPILSLLLFALLRSCSRSSESKKEKSPIVRHEQIQSIMSWKACHCIQSRP